MNEHEDTTSAFIIFNEIRLERRLCDVVLRVDDVDFYAHKVILCSCSSYFRDLFLFGSCQPDAKEEHVYSIPGVSSNMMRLIIDYAYTHYILVTEENVEELCAAAAQLSIMGIVDACSKFLGEQLCPYNCISIWKLADMYHCPELRSKAYLFILHHFEETVATSKDFLQLSMEQLADIIQRDDLNVKQESTVFQAILHWINHLPEERKDHIPLLLSKVRLALMTTDFVMNNVKNHALVKDSDECRPIVTSALVTLCNLSNRRTSNLVYQKFLARPRMPYAILLAIGGWSGSGPTNGIDAYDHCANRWVNVTNDEESSRAYHGAAFLNGFVYCIGGYDNIEYFSSVCKFDLETHTWHQVAPMNSRRCYVSVVVLNGFIYAMGGYDGHVRLNTAEHYEPKTNQWTVLAPMCEQRSDANATTLHGKIYICGGFNGNECLVTAERYNPETNQWTMIAPMTSRRSGLGVIAYGEYIYAVGGYNGNNRLRSVEAYNPVNNAWHAAPSMLKPRSNFGIAVVNSQLFVVGGFNGFTTMFKVERFDDKDRKWYRAHNMEISRSAVSCCVVHGLPNMAKYAAPRDALPLPSIEGDGGGSKESV